MKIAFLEDGAFAYASGSAVAIGGAERDQWLLGAALAHFGWDVTVGVRTGLNPNERKTIDGVEFVGIGRGQILLNWYRFLAFEQPDWLFWECADYRWGPLVEIAKLAGVRTIFAAGCDLDVQPRRFTFHRSQYWRLYAWGLSRTDRIFVQHTGQLSGLCPRWRAKASVLPKVCVFASNDGGAPPLRSHSGRAKYVAWVGRLIELKRPDRLLKIAVAAPDIQFVVCGGSGQAGSDYEARLVESLRTAANITYLGQVPPDKAQQIIDHAALLLSTSDVEGFPNTFVQAWSSGTPIVSLTVDPDDIIKRFRLGAVSGDSNRAIEDMRALLKSCSTRDEIAKRARLFVLENYRASSVVSLFERALASTVHCSVQ